MDTMQGGCHQLPQESDLNHAIGLVKVLSRYYDDEVSGDAPWPWSAPGKRANVSSSNL